MKEKRSINIEKETKQGGKARPVEAAKHSGVPREGETKQYPPKVGYHGSDNEKELNPEE